MKIATRDTQGFLAHPARDFLGVLLHGSDNGLIREYVKQITERVLGKGFDPMNFTELTEDRIKQDPASLKDELCALSLLGGGGNRAIYIRDASDKIATLLQEIYQPEFQPTAYLILAGDEGATVTNLRKWGDSHPQIATVGCYHDEGKNLEQLIRTELNAAGIKCSQDVLAFLSEHCGNDRLVTKQEIEKIKLFQGSDPYLTLDHAAALIGQNDFFTLDDLSMAVASAQMQDVESYLARLLRENIQPVAIIRTLQRYFQRLEVVRLKMAEGANLDTAMAGLRPQVFFKYVPVFRQHINRWTLPRIQAALSLILDTERELKTTGYPAPLMLSRGLVQVAQLSKIY